MGYESGLLGESGLGESGLGHRSGLPGGSRLDQASGLPGGSRLGHTSGPLGMWHTWVRGLGSARQRIGLALGLE